LFNKLFFLLFIFTNIYTVLHANERQLIIDQINRIENIVFNFKQTTNEKKEFGLCTLVFDNKLSCDYKDFEQKRILINGKILVVQKKKYNKNYFYPLSNSPFVKIFNKNNLVDLIQQAELQRNDTIEITYIGENKEKIIIFFSTDTYDLVGWRIVDQLKNIINFSIEIKYKNSEINSKIFEIPSIN
tara:strand:+ start:1026 stop:1583 length:558 start_codon:yes stop_codon:yes gene_type:complete